MITIGTNTVSQTVQRRLGQATAEQSVAASRLSSGQRINSASDDAAGLSISTSLNKDRVLAQAARRNINDGISLVSIASSGIASQKEILQRMSELAAQSSSGSYSSQQRQALQQEYSALMDEYDRIGAVTQFNGVQLLKNTGGDRVSLAVGINGSDASAISVATVNNHRFAGTLGYRIDLDGSNVVNSADQFRALSATSATYVSQADTNNLFQDYGVLQVRDSTGSQVTARILPTFVINMQNSFVLSGSNYYASDAGVQVDMEPTPGFFHAVIAGTRENGEVAGSATTTVSTAATSASIGISFATSGATASVALDLSGISYRVLDWGRAARNSVVGFTNIESAQAARRALDTIANRSEEIAAMEGRFGAATARLQVANNVVGAMGENFAAASSRILDADVAAEAANAVRSQIRQQTAAALLGQANQAPVIALRLLQGG